MIKKIFNLFHELRLYFLMPTKMVARSDVIRLSKSKCFIISCIFSIFMPLFIIIYFNKHVSYTHLYFSFFLPSYKYNNSLDFSKIVEYLLLE